MSTERKIEARARDEELFLLLEQASDREVSREKEEKEEEVKEEKIPFNNQMNSVELLFDNINL